VICFFVTFYDATANGPGYAWSLATPQLSLERHHLLLLGQVPANNVPRRLSCKTVMDRYNRDTPQIAKLKLARIDNKGMESPDPDESVFLAHWRIK
jgi:hypothetical protein